MAMQEWAEDACDTIDAGFFSGDSFHDREAIARMKYYMDRWTRVIEDIEESLNEQEKEHS